MRLLHKLVQSRASGAVATVIALSYGLESMHGAALAQTQFVPPEIPATVSEFRLKAAFVLNAVIFTEWPADTLADGSNLVICLRRDSPLRAALIEISDRIIKGHPIFISAPVELDSGRPCHVQFLDRVDQPRWAQLKKSLAGSSVLTIADQDDSPFDGAVITMLRDHQRFQFSVDRQAARDAKLVLSSKLLRLAKSTQ